MVSNSRVDAAGLSNFDYLLKLSFKIEQGRMRFRLSTPAAEHTRPKFWSQSKSNNPVRSQSKQFSCRSCQVPTVYKSN